jgi:signal transduction histidine kinase/ActR/RegA family two-component response regulator
MKVRAHLALMAAGMLLPMCILSGVALKLVLDNQREAAERSVRETVRLLALAVDREIAIAETALRVLAASHHLEKDDLAGFYRRATEARTSDSAWIVLFDRDGQQVLNTRAPYGTPLPRTAVPERIMRIIESQRPKVSSMLVGALSKQRIISFDAPVPAQGGKRYVLSQAVSSEYFNRVFRERDIPPDWIVAINDAEGITVARSHNPERFVGTPVPDPLRKIMFAQTEGVYRQTSREGIPMVGFFARVPRSDWVVALGVPTHVLDATARRATLLTGLGLLTALGFAAAVALVFGRRFSRAIERAALSTVALARGERPRREPQASSISEVQRLHAALEEASGILEREKEARGRAEDERARLFASEQLARQQAEAQNKTKDEFLAMLGHELRNPLNAIAGSVAILNAPAAKPENTAYAREVIGRQTQHLSRVVDDLLDLSRVMTGKILLDLQPVDLADAMRRALATMRAAGLAQRHELSVTGESVWVRADVTRLDQVITNLVTNALKYTPEGGRIDVHMGREGEDGVLSVRDSGIGISDALMPHIFDIFVQGEASLDRAQGGLGIGLALVRRLLSLHGGSVSAASEGPGRGSSFTVRLPVIEAPGQATATPALAAGKQARRVLLVDDHHDARSTMRLLIGLEGHQVLEARDGLEGVRCALRERPDIAFVDIGLPGIDGYEVARQLRANAATRTMTLVALTGYGQDNDRSRALEAGFDLHLVKPMDPEAVMQAIESANARR